MDIKEDDLKIIAYEKAIEFREKYKLGNYCAKQLIDILDLLEEDTRTSIKLIRTPFKNYKLAGFIGFKHNTFVIVINTNQTLGNVRFTIAHEIYHLLSNRTSIKENSVLEENMQTIEGKEDTEDMHEIMANAFAAELLIPKNDIEDNIKKLTENRMKSIDVFTVIQLQQKYGVDYKAITKRLREINIIQDQQQNELESILDVTGKLENLTKNLGYNNDLNVASRGTQLMQKDLQILKENYDKGDLNYDDLVRIFGYLGTNPEEYGYVDEVELSEEAKAFMKGLYS